MRTLRQPLPVAGSMDTLRIDLNMLRGDKIRARRDFAERCDDLLPNLRVGQMVRAVDEDGDFYFAVVEEVDGLRVKLRLDLDSRYSAALTA